MHVFEEVGMAKYCVALIVALTLAPLASANPCRLSLAEQGDEGQYGFGVEIDNDTGSAAACILANASLNVYVGDGTQLNWLGLVPGSGWKLNTEYTAVVTITPTETKATVNGIELASASQGFVPYAGLYQGNNLYDWASYPATYTVVEDKQSISTIGLKNNRNVDISYAEEDARPAALWAITTEGRRRGLWTTQPGESIQLTIKFRFMTTPVTGKYQPYFDQFGQSVYGDWLGKAHSITDIRAAYTKEKEQLDAWGSPHDLDEFGGLITSKWKSEGNGFFTMARINGYWWLITPLGNPCFYISLDNAPNLQDGMTPISGRTQYFTSPLPSQSAYPEAYGTNIWNEGSDTLYLSYLNVNIVNKYGPDWQNVDTDLTFRRMSSWGFSGLGKWADPGTGHPYMGQLSRGNDSTAVPGGHPDVFDPAVEAAFASDIDSQIGSEKADPNIVGWSLGNEDDEIINGWEVQGIVQLGLVSGEPVPAKKFFIQYALKHLYGNSVSALATAWGAPSDSTLDRLYANVNLNPPATDVETLREQYSWNYYNFIYKTVKAYDPNHLYFGCWIVPENDVANASDWHNIADNTDVIGYDLYSFYDPDQTLSALFASTGKPVYLGEFGFPPTYRMQRGFSPFDGNVFADDDAQAADLYGSLLRTASENPYIVGVGWFEYHDEAVSGRGPLGSGSRYSLLVAGEDFAEGLVDVTDSYKSELVKPLRQANIDAAPRRLSRTIP